MKQTFLTFVIVLCSILLAHGQTVEINNILAIANAAIANINVAETHQEITDIKNRTLADLALPIKCFNSGRTEAQAALPTAPEGTAGPAVEIIKDGKKIILYNPDNVNFINIEKTE